MDWDFLRDLRDLDWTHGIPAFGAKVREHLGESVYASAARFFDATPFALG